ncbi:SDR family NAD(P)-dependent oxidoreductase [Mesobaculum littorinae]|uniref:SDR family NAD(P)-dependent oxidoreductase n=1 Tax=Mesobaculum littorinae TaxID=2486419 RepID=UPI0038B3FA07
MAPVLLPLDLTDPAAPAALAERLGADPIDLLVCNAGMFADRHDTVAGGYPAPLWAEEFQVNVTGAFLTVQALLPQLRAGKGRIALISSQMASDAAPGGNALIYRATKAALLNLGRNLAVALEGDGIAVGIYHPGWVRTDMGGAGAAISASESAEGLAARFDALSPETSGAFLTWDGRPHAH